MADSRNETVTIPIAHEELFTSTREVETGRVRVMTVIDEREEIVRHELARSIVDVERVTVDREVDEIPAPRMEGDVFIIPVVKEVLFVRKALVLTEGSPTASQDLHRAGGAAGNGAKSARRCRT